MTRSQRVEVVATPITTVRYTQRPGVVDRPPVDIYARRNWRFLRSRPVRAGRYLDAGEYCRHAQPLHWIGLVRAVIGVPHLRLLRYRVVAAGVTGLLGAALLGLWQAQVLLGAVAVAHSGHMVWRALGWRAMSVIVTDRRLICPRGVIGRRVASTPLFRITNHEHYQSWLGRLLGYGTLRIETGGAHDDGAERELVRFVIDPESVDRMLSAPARRGW